MVSIIVGGVVAGGRWCAGDGLLISMATTPCSGSEYRPVEQFVMVLLGVMADLPALVAQHNT
jgi:hypothetical protein